MNNEQDINFKFEIEKQLMLYGMCYIRTAKDGSREVVDGKEMTVISKDTQTFKIEGKSVIANVADKWSKEPSDPMADLQKAKDYLEEVNTTFEPAIPLGTKTQAIVLRAMDMYHELISISGMGMNGYNMAVVKLLYLQNRWLS